MTAMELRTRLSMLPASPAGREADLRLLHRLCARSGERDARYRAMNLEWAAVIRRLLAKLRATRADKETGQ